MNVVLYFNNFLNYGPRLQSLCHLQGTLQLSCQLSYENGSFGFNVRGVSRLEIDFCKFCNDVVSK